MGTRPASRTGTRAAIYVRISKDKVGAGLGVERQEADCRELAARLGWTVVEVFCDNDISAYSGKVRKRYRAMLDAIQSGRVDAVLVWHTDRLHRSPAELEDFIAICQPRDVPTHGVKAGELDLSTASGRMTARIVGAVARHESEHSSERIRAQKAAALARGEWTGGARPFGYRRILGEDGRATIDVVPAEAEAIKAAVDAVIGGESVYSVAKRWQADGLAPARGGEWHIGNVTRILCRPRSAGLVEHRGEILDGVRGEWPTIITEDQYRSVCAILKNPARNTYSGVRSLKWVGSGLYRCGRCGGDMRSASQLARADGSLRRTYRCRSGVHVTIAGEPVDEAIIKAVCAVLDERGAGLVPAEDRSATKALHAEANALRARLGELEDMYGDGEISRAGYLRQQEKITGKLDAVTVQLDATQTGSALDGIATAPSPSAAFLAAPVARQRAVVDALMTVTIVPGKAGRMPKDADVLDRVQVRLRGAEDEPLPEAV